MGLVRLIRLSLFRLLPSTCCLAFLAVPGHAQAPPETEPLIPLSLNLAGEVSWQVRQESGLGAGLAQIPRRDLRLRLDPRLSLWGVVVSGKFLYTSLDKVSTPARNRLNLTLERGPLRISVGDAYADSSPFVARGARVRGISGSMETDRVTLTFLTGESKRSVEGTFDAAADRVTRFGTYRRTLTSVNVDVAAGSGLSLSAGVVSGEDKRSSILYGRSPRNNTAYGAEVAYDPGKHGIELGLSVGISDTEISATERNAHEALNSKLAYELKARGMFRVHRLSVAYYSKDTHYESFGTPTLTPDRKGFRVEDRIDFLHKRASLTAQLRRQENNVDGAKDLTLTTTRPSAVLVFKQGARLPGIRLSVYRTLSSNEALNSDSRRVDHHLDEGKIQLSKDFKTKTIKWTPGLSLKRQIKTDKARSPNEFTRTTVLVSSKAAFRNYSPLLQYAYSETDYEHRNAVRRSSITLKHSLRAGNRVQITGKQVYTLDASGSRTVGERVEIEAGVVYRLIPKKLNLSTTFKYFDFSSETRVESNYHGYDFLVKVSTAGTLELIPWND